MKPNILVIFTDQQRGDTIAALGNPVIKTPHFDRIANEGVAFTNAFSPSPVCISARCSHIYGQYPANTGCYSNTPMPTDNRQSYMAALTGAGYRTHGIGKCHFSPDWKALRGFQTRQTQEELVDDPQQVDYLKWLHSKGYDYVCDPMGIRGEMYYIPQPAQFPAEVHPTQWTGDQAVSFIDKQNDSDEPWHLYASFLHPHPPFTPPNPWHKLYRAPMMPLPNVPQDFESLWTYINRVQNRYKYRDQGIDLNLLRNMKAYYYACISFIDFQVGRILESLERTGQLDNTLIICTADHGEHLGDYHCFGKRSMHDSSARIPMLTRLPGVFEGGDICSRPVNLVDIAPTVLGVTETKINTHELDGESMVDVYNGSTDRQAVFSQHDTEGRGLYMAVTEQWKYVYSAADDREFLFDRQTDPLETRNKAGLTFCRETRNRMKQTLIDHLKSVGEAKAIDGDDWRRYPRLTISDDPDSGLLIQDHVWAKTDIPGYTD